MSATFKASNAIKIFLSHSFPHSYNLIITCKGILNLTCNVLEAIPHQFGEIVEELENHCNGHVLKLTTSTIISARNAVWILREQWNTVYCSHEDAVHIITVYNTIAIKLKVYFGHYIDMIMIILCTFWHKKKRASLQNFIRFLWARKCCGTPSNPLALYLSNT